MHVTTEPAEPSRRHAYWWPAGAVVIVAVAATLVLTTGHAGDGENTASAPTTARTATSTAASTGYDLTTPEAAAKSFAAAAATNDGDTLLSLACVGHLACVDEHAADMDTDRLAAARAVITENTYELADHLTDAEFSPAVDGTVPGAKDVPYRTPAMTGDALPTLTFVRSGGEWLYLGPAI